MAMEIAPLIAKYGYAGAFAGAILEGETVLILAGLGAHRGYLSLPLLVALGALGGAVGDLIYFALGRHYGEALLDRFPKFAPAARKVHRLIERYPNATVLGVRFLYGLRTVGPAVIGTSGLPWPRFILLNALGASVWSATWVGAGYVLGEAAERLLGNVARIEREFFIAALVVALVVSVGLHFWRRHVRADRPQR